MKALVTGASGFVGSAVLRRRVAAGGEVRALVRKGSDLGNLSGVACELRYGDLADAGSLAAALEGCEALFHVAADYRLWVPQPAAIYRTNVDGTRTLMRAALAAGISRVVYTSSVATLGLRADAAPADEMTPSTLADMIGHYSAPNSSPRRRSEASCTRRDFRPSSSIPRPRSGRAMRVRRRPGG
jgi:dihydroflavonol-4-reductase